jgi:hypothetical protein
VLGLLAFLALSSARATSYYVANAIQLNSLTDSTGARFATLYAGDRVYLLGGSNWGGTNVTLTGSMTDTQAQTNPAIVYACDANYNPTVGGVTVEGLCQIDLAGTGIVFAGVTFDSFSGMNMQGNYTDYDDTGASAYIIQMDGASRYMTVSHCNFNNCGYNNTSALNDHYGPWVFFHGYHHTLQYCEFTGRSFNPTDYLQTNPLLRTTIRDSTVVVYIAPTDVNFGYHAIRYCYFGPRLVPLTNDPRLYLPADGNTTSNMGNGYETIRVGDSSFLDTDLNTTVEYNTRRGSLMRFGGMRQLFAVVLLVLPGAAFSAESQPAEMAGYLLVSSDKVPDAYNAGFSLYAAAWPLLQQYPGHRFQTGLFGTWMHAQYEGKPPADLYSDIEGGLGWWRDTRFATETPKFIMGGVAVNFKEIANGPAHGRGTWAKPEGLYGVAQLSPWLLFPIDGLNLKQGVCGELFGYGYLPLPLTAAKTTTGGKNVATGDNCWTLFLNTKNFKGPVCFFTPYFWSHSAELNPDYAGLLLDSRPSAPNKPFQMETQYVPAAISVDEKGETCARVAPTSFPVGPDGATVVLHRLTSYTKKALWDGVQAWFAGGPAATGAIDSAGAYVQTLRPNGGSTWKIYAEKTPKEQKIALDWSSFATPIAPDPTTYGYKWNDQLVSKLSGPTGARIVLPEYFTLRDDGKKPHWVATKPADLPAQSGLAAFHFDRPKEGAPEPYDTPEAPESSFKMPGPVAGPFKAHLGDGSVVTYYWYRFADQPALLNADLTKEEREKMQAKVEKLHRAWTKDHEYLAPPTVGTLADLDPAQLVTPPKGLEIGYVPIATRQELDPARPGKWTLR